MTAFVDVRPPGLDLVFRPGDSFALVMAWPTGELDARTFFATLDGEALDVGIVGDVMTITVSAEQTAVAPELAPMRLVEQKPGGDETVMIGRWSPSTYAATAVAAEVTVSGGSADVVIEVATVPASVSASFAALGTQVDALDSAAVKLAGDQSISGVKSFTSEPVVPGLHSDGEVLGHQPSIFWQNQVAQTIPNAVWTPVIWNNRLTTIGSWSDYAPASTTVAAASNGAALPQGTINVASTAGFKSSGYLAVRIGGTDRVVAYTGMTATSFTGCTLGVGTLATGQVVAQANVEFTPPGDGLTPAVAEIAWASNGTGVRGTRVRFLDVLGAGFHIAGGTDVRGAVATANPYMRTTALEQPAGSVANRIEVYQSSGGDLATVVDEFAAPRLVATLTSSYAG